MFFRHTSCCGLTPVRTFTFLRSARLNEQDMWTFWRANKGVARIFRLGGVAGKSSRQE